ncbi:hypothetical protein DPMN_041620 [Dreissena polymorpha]|uniref:Uncharacterized protein n=1 Tax=Dreissena polymorpha TaxID=45954 RepID=A0A9D4HW91_DREPO|nr:hypothetical protein DPMN_041620 [Dreissena polymorpha]
MLPCDLQSLQQEVLGHCWQQLPNIIDAVGMGVQDSPDIQEILDVVKIEEVPNVFNIKGSYVGDSEDDPYIDNIALEFIKQMMQPKRQQNRIKLDTMPLMMR